MNVLLTGATGFIGRALHAALLAAGHRVIGVSRAGAPSGGVHHGARDATRWAQLDFAQATQPQQWLPLLSAVDAVVNAVGIFRESTSQRFDTLHVRAPVALFEACVQAGVRRVVQISALGADAHAASAYHLSKKAADDALLAMPLQATVVQPSLVFGAAGASSALFLQLATLPVLPLPAGGRQPVQPVHLDDLVGAIVALLQAPAARWQGRRVAFVGPRPLGLGDYLQTLRRGLALPPAPTLSVPARWVDFAARAGDHLPGALLDRASWQMLQRGNTADAADITSLLGAPPRDPSRFLDAEPVAARRAEATLAWGQPLLRAALAFVWLWTAAVSAGLYPVQASYSLLAAVGAPPGWRPLLLYGAAALDLVLGVLCLAPLRGGRLRWLWRAQMLLIVGYTAIISVRLPAFWLHPYGPLSKNLPMLALLVVLHALTPDEAAARHRAPSPKP